MPRKETWQTPEAECVGTAPAGPGSSLEAAEGKVLGKEADSQAHTDPGQAADRKQG